MTDLTDDCWHRRGLGYRSGCVFYRSKAVGGFAAFNVAHVPLNFLAFHRQCQGTGHPNTWRSSCTMCLIVRMILSHFSIRLLAAVQQQVRVYHPVDANLGLVYAVMLTDDKDPFGNEPVANVVVWGQVSWWGQQARPNKMVFDATVACFGCAICALTLIPAFVGRPQSMWLRDHCTHCAAVR